MLEETRLSNVSVVEDVVIISIKNLQINAAELFTKLAMAGINVDVISQNMTHDISFTIQKKDLERLKLRLESIPFENLELKEGVVKLSIIGNAMRTKPGVAAQAFELFYKEGVEFYQVSTSEISISFILDETHKDKMVNLMMDAFKINEEEA